MERLKAMKESLMGCVEGQIHGHLNEVDAKELGEAVDMIKDLSEAIYYCTITEAMEKGDEEKCRQASDKFVELMRDNEMFAQKVLDVHNTCGVVASRWNIPRSAYWDAD